MDLQLTVTQAFRKDFSKPPAFIVRAPGRVNIIGEHTDYNDGFVLPMAIDRAVWIALRPRPDRQVIVHSLDFEETAEFSLDNLQKGNGWIEYVKGVAWAMQVEKLKIEGWEGILTGNVPIGAGLSSSAALELASARAFAAVSDLEWEPIKMAHLCLKSENEWVGLNCGIMDQMISALAQEGHALFLDCRSLNFEQIPMPSGLSVVVLDTATRRGLVGSDYNKLRAQCETAARFFGVSTLRDVDMEVFEARANRLDPLIQRRARHVIYENQRVREAAAFMRFGYVEKLGGLLNASHASLRDDFGVSSPALDSMVEIACQAAGCVGARMIGAGFGGCAVALVRAEKVREFGIRIVQEYSRQTGLKPNVYVSQAAGGASLVRA